MLAHTMRAGSNKITINACHNAPELKKTILTVWQCNKCAFQKFLQSTPPFKKFKQLPLFIEIPPFFSDFWVKEFLYF